VADIGLIGVAIAGMQAGGERLEIDTFLISCRALGRGAEDALLARIIDHAAHKGCREVVGAYLPTKKNEQVADFYAKRGFTERPGAGVGTSWRLDVGVGRIKTPDWIKIIDGSGDDDLRQGTKNDGQ